MLYLTSSIYKIIFIFSLYKKVIGSCNITAYSEWKQAVYDGVLVDDLSFWRYGATQVTLTKTLALELAVQKCKAKFNDLIVFRAGGHGPLAIHHSYDAMCSLVCLEIDKIVNEAMFLTQCSCLQLSTQPGEFSYHGDGDVCNLNTGRILCSFSFCGTWECRLDDFMCPRFEFNKQHIVARGLGSCVSSSAVTTYKLSYPLYALLTITVVVMTSMLYS